MTDPFTVMVGFAFCANAAQNKIEKHVASSNGFNVYVLKIADQKRHLLNDCIKINTELGDRNFFTAN